MLEIFTLYFLIYIAALCGLTVDKKSMIPLNGYGSHNPLITLSQTWKVLGPFQIGTRGTSPPNPVRKIVPQLLKGQ